MAWPGVAELEARLAALGVDASGMDLAAVLAESVARFEHETGWDPFWAEPAPRARSHRAASPYRLYIAGCREVSSVDGLAVPGNYAEVRMGTPAYDGPVYALEPLRPSLPSGPTVEVEARYGAFEPHSREGVLAVEAVLSGAAARASALASSAPGPLAEVRQGPVALRYGLTEGRSRSRALPEGRHAALAAAYEDAVARLRRPTV